MATEDHEARIAALESEVRKLRSAINLLFLSLDEDPVDVTTTDAESVSRSLGLPPVEGS